MGTPGEDGGAGGAGHPRPGTSGRVGLGLRGGPRGSCRADSGLTLALTRPRSRCSSAGPRGGTFLLFQPRPAPRCPRLAGPGPGRVGGRRAGRWRGGRSVRAGAVAPASPCAHSSPFACRPLPTSRLRVPPPLSPPRLSGCFPTPCASVSSSRARPRSHPAEVLAVLVPLCCVLTPRGGSSLPSAPLGAPEEPPLSFPKFLPTGSSHLLCPPCPGVLQRRQREAGGRAHADRLLRHSGLSRPHSAGPQAGGGDSVC